MKEKRSKLENVLFTNVSIEDQFWAPRIRAHKAATLDSCIQKCEETGRISNFSRAAGLEEGGFQGIYFDDSDVYKVLEGIAYSLMNISDSELERKADEIIAKIAAAQEDNGYLMPYFTLLEKDSSLVDVGAQKNFSAGKPGTEKWADMAMCEMYNGGHLIEAAVAYYNATGKRVLLDVACKLADHYDSLFGPGKRHWVPGHQEIELALVKLYQTTGENRYWQLAQWLLEERGHGHGVGYIWEEEQWGTAYCQDDRPVRELSHVSGHAVRAMYYYSAIADVASLTNNQDHIEALDCLWDSVVNRNMYITGGIGPSKHNEGFTEDYDLPNEAAYCETCASIGMVLWNHRMNLLHGEGKYADIVERAMYNGVLSGISLTGDKFFYVNPLSSGGHHHRVPWYDVSCCPTNLSRFLPSIGNYVYSVDTDNICVNQYIAGKGKLKIESSTVNLEQKTNYPWTGKVKIIVKPEVPSEFLISLRYPGWCKSAMVMVNGVPVEELKVEKGYIRLRKKWKEGDKVEIDFDMPVERVHADPRVKENRGRVAFQRGPLVYCGEETDNSINLDDITISSDTRLFVKHLPELLGGVCIIKGIDMKGDDEFTAVPYYTWDNREPGKMIVWFHESVEEKQLYRL